MVKPLPKWLQIRYADLWSKFGEESFGFERAKKSLEEEEYLSNVLSELKKAGWISVGLNSKDSRKRVYELKKPKEIIEKIAEENDGE